MTWLATALGLAGGFALAMALAKALFGRYLLTRMVLGGLAVAIIPALVLGIAAGAPLGGAVGRQIFRELGLPSSGDMFGVASGVALMLALVVLAGGASGLAIVKAIECWMTRK